MSLIAEGFPRKVARGAALALSLAVHLALFAWLLATTLGSEPAPPAPRAVMLELVRLPPPLSPPPPKEIKELPVRKEVKKLPEPVPPPPRQIENQQPEPPLKVAPPVHEFVANDSDWVVAATVDERAAGGPRRVPPDYADKVKAKVISKIDYPPDAVFKPPPGYKGDPKLLKRQCTIPYEIVVDRNGKMISHVIEPCGDDLLDAAAEAAILKSGPYPPPPNLGAEQYIIYGSANFRMR